MKEILNKIFFRLHLFVFGKECPKCQRRQFIGTNLCGFEEGKMVFGKICYYCFAFYKVVNGRMTFEGFMDGDKLDLNQ